jgi:hypothetical protein
MNKIAFGSCNRQNKDQSYWLQIKEHLPTHFIWTGDAVYSKGSDITKLEKAYRNLTTNNHYLSFIEDVEVDGVWDDHDYGVNDGGKHIENQDARQFLYTNFLSTRATKDYLKLQHKGLYHSKLIEIDGIKLNFIFLDTRTFRDHHWIRSLGELNVKGSALVASALRGAYSILGFGRNYDGEMLGSTQWAWLEQTLHESNELAVDINVVISSIQVMTSNPVFESWGHFPVEKRRLFRLLQDINPRGDVVFLSGDVHLGELSAAKVTRADGSKHSWVEVTSSGLTHSCSDGIANTLLCPLMMTMFQQHRTASRDVFLQKNFGLISKAEVEAEAVQAMESVSTGSPSEGGEVTPTSSSNSTSSSADRSSTNWAVDFSVYPIVAPLFPVLTHTVRGKYDSSTGTGTGSVGGVAGKGLIPGIVAVEVPDFPVLNPVVAVLLCLIVMAAPFMLAKRYRKRKTV